MKGLTIQMDATAIASATVPLWMEKVDPGSNIAKGFLELQEMVCLDNLINSLVLAESIYVPNAEALKNGGKFAERFLYRDWVGIYAKTFQPELNGVVFDSVAPLISDGVIVGGDMLPKAQIEVIEKSLANLMEDRDFQERIVQMMDSVSGMPVLSDIRSVWGYSAPQNPFGHAFNDGVEFVSFPKWISDSSLKSVLHQFIYSIDPRPKWVTHGEPLLWISSFILRGLFYDEVAKLKGYLYLPHPLRLPQAVASSRWDGDKSNDFFRMPIQSLKEIRSDLLDGLAGCVAPHVDIDVPPLLSVVLRNAKTREEIFSEALKLRNSQTGRDLRELVGVAVKVVEEGDGKFLAELSSDIKKLSDNLAKENGFEVETIQPQLLIFRTNLRLPPFLHKSFYVRNNHLRGLYDISKSLLSVSSARVDIARLFFN